MMNKTHLAVGFGVALYFLPYIADKALFLVVVMVSSLLPNASVLISPKREHSILKHIKPASASQRGFSHTYTLCVFVSLIFAFFYPVLALPFFLGYSFHLYLDAFTKDGIRPFWPLRKKASGRIKTGGPIDATIFYVLLLVDFALLAKLFI